MRVPAERRADLLAQQAACRAGERGLLAMTREHGAAEVRARASELMDWTAALMRARLAELPEGEWRFADELETAGERASTIRLRLACRRGALELDFRDTDDQVAEPVNTVRAVVVSAVFYVLRLLLPGDVPTNDGVLRGVTILTREGSLVDAHYPAPVAAGNVETSQRLVDVLLGALAQALPESVPAASSGTMSNLTYGSDDAASSGARFTYYETIAGGAGGGPRGAGEHAVQTHMTNTRNTPIEALENALPVRVMAYDVRRSSGGAGKHRGGDGVRKRLRFLAPVHAGWVAERQRRGPWGLAGGRAGSPGRAVVRVAGEARDEPLAGKASVRLPAGSELEVWSPGGGGWGR
jgi:N-methylhydantoinase B